MRNQKASYNRYEQVKDFIIGKSVLEIGFWDHNDLWEYHARGAHYWYGIDFNKEAVQLAQNKGFDAIQWDLETMGIPKADRSFDCILMRHVLEHLDNVVLFLVKLSEYYHPKMIVIEVPNAGWWALPFYTAITDMHLDYHSPLHVREFLPRHFYEITKRAKILNVTEIRYLHSFGTTFFGHFVDYIIGMLFPKLRRNLLCILKNKG